MWMSPQQCPLLNLIYIQKAFEQDVEDEDGLRFVRKYLFWKLIKAVKKLSEMLAYSIL